MLVCSPAALAGHRCPALVNLRRAWASSGSQTERGVRARADDPVLYDLERLADLLEQYFHPSNTGSCARRRASALPGCRAALPCFNLIHVAHV